MSSWISKKSWRALNARRVAALGFMKRSSMMSGVDRKQQWSIRRDRLEVVCCECSPKIGKVHSVVIRDRCNAHGLACSRSKQGARWTGDSFYGGCGDSIEHGSPNASLKRLILNPV